MHFLVFIPTVRNEEVRRGPRGALSVLYLACGWRLQFNICGSVVVIHFTYGRGATLAFLSLEPIACFIAASFTLHYTLIYYLALRMSSRRTSPPPPSGMRFFAFWSRPFNWAKICDFATRLNGVRFNALRSQIRDRNEFEIR